MWIRSQDKNQLVNIIRFTVSNAIGGSKKGIIRGKYAGDTFLSDNSVSLGTYNTVEDAKRELDDLQKFMIDNPNGIYEMK